MMQGNHFERIMKMGGVFLTILSIFFVVLTINAIRENEFIGADAFPQTTISVRGEGEAFAVPNVAKVSFTVREQGDDVASAQDKATEKMNTLLGTLDDFGIEEEDIKTTSYNAFPRYEYRRDTIVCVTAPCIQPAGKQVLVGYEVSQSIRLTIRDTEDAGEVLTLIGESGVDNVSGLTFTVEDEEEVIREARRLAIEDAEEKAEKLADDLDVRLVRVVSFFEESGFGEPYYAFAENAGFGGDMAVSRSAPEIPVGEDKTTVSVNITYEIR